MRAEHRGSSCPSDGPDLPRSRAEHPRRRGAVATAAVAGLLLTGCSSGSGDAGTTSTPPAAVSPTEVSTPAGVVTPTLAPQPTQAPAAEPVRPVKPKAKHTQAGAEAFARYFWGAYTYAYQALDTGPLTAASTDDCRYCKRAVKAAQRLKDDDNAVIGNAVVVHEATAPKKPGQRVTVRLTISRTRGRSVKVDGTKHALKAVPEHAATLTLIWSKKAWHVADVAEKG
jgi:hypothetical protein